MSFSIYVRSTWEFRRLATSRNTTAKLADNDFGSTGSRYSLTPFKSGKGMLTSSSIPRDHMDVYFLLPSFSSPYVSTILNSFVILDFGLPVYQFLPGIWSWCIIVFLSSSVISMLPLTSVLFLSLGLQLVMKLAVPLMFLVLPWLFLEPSSPARTDLSGVHWIKHCSWSLLNPFFLQWQ